MTLQEAYFFLLADCLMSAIIFPIQTNLAFPAMKIFDNYNMSAVVFIASIGTTFGLVLNWTIGKAIAKTMVYDPKTERGKKFVNFLQTKGSYILLFSWVPILGSILSLFLGVVNSRLKMLVSIALAANFAYYCLLAIT